MQQVHNIKAIEQSRVDTCRTCGGLGILYNMETDNNEPCWCCEYEGICDCCGDSGEDIWGDECTVCDFNKAERV